MPRTPATSSMVSVASQPFSSCATMSAPITADCFWSAGYFRTSLFISSKDLAERGIAHLPIDFSQDNIHGADDRHRLRDHVPPGHLVHRRQVREPRRADLEAVGLVGAVGHEIDAEFPLRVLDRRVALAFGHVH